MFEILDKLGGSCFVNIGLVGCVDIVIFIFFIYGSIVIILFVCFLNYKIIVYCIIM